MRITPKNRTGIIVSSAIVALGALLLVLSLIPELGMKITLPLVFLMAGTGFILLEFALAPRLFWAGYFYIPGGLSLAFGAIFLVISFTGDWQAWAYAWMLLPVGAGVGMLLAGRSLGWGQVLHLIGGGMVVFGAALFVFFGAIAGGLFIQIMAPVLLVSGGLAVYWIGFDNLTARWFPAKGAPPGKSGAALHAADAQTQLVEPLSAREIEVLRLIGEGLTNMEIATKLTLAHSTVKTHINNIYTKLGVRTRTQAVRRGQALGILD